MLFRRKYPSRHHMRLVPPVRPDVARLTASVLGSGIAIRVAIDVAEVPRLACTDQMPAAPALNRPRGHAARPPKPLLLVPPVVARSDSLILRLRLAIVEAKRFRLDCETKYRSQPGPAHLWRSRIALDHLGERSSDWHAASAAAGPSRPEEPPPSPEAGLLHCLQICSFLLWTYCALGSTLGRPLAADGGSRARHYLAGY
jgi:hypothetical protein